MTTLADQTALDILDAKLALEEELIEPLAIALSTYLSTWEKGEGVVRMIDHVAHREQIEAVLVRHYARVISVMSGRAPQEGDRLDAVVLSPLHAERLRARARNQTMHMIRGMDRDLMTILMSMPVPTIADMHRQEAGKSSATGLETKKGGAGFTVQYIGRFKETAKQAWAKLKSRMRAIANLETESVAEEHQVEWVKQKYANSRIYKTWRNPMDGKERPWHHDAHVEYSDEGIPVDQPFVVGGEQLMQPGDSSRGASLANLIGCRCYSAYHIVGPNGERINIPLQTPAIPAKRTWHQGDRLGVETPVRATESITMTGRTRANVVLGDGRTFAVMQQVAPDTVVVRVAGRDIARATFSNGAVTSMTTAQDVQHLDVDGLIRRSVTETQRLLTPRR